MRYYPHDIAAYMSATAHLSNGEDLAYLRILQLYYLTEKPIDLNLEKVARRIRCPKEDVFSVIGEFFTRGEDGFHNERADEEIAAFRAKSEQARKAAFVRFGRKADEQRPESEEEADGMRTHSGRNADAKRTECHKIRLEEKRLKEKDKEKNPPVGGLKESGAAAPAAFLKNRFGEFDNVRLTAEQKGKLDTRFGTEKVAHYIERLSRYLEQMKKADPYKSHYAVILTWIDKDGTKALQGDLFNTGDADFRKAAREKSKTEGSATADDDLKFLEELEDKGGKK